MGHISCPNCHNNTHRSVIYKCGNCGLVFCDNCGNYPPLLSLAHTKSFCPNRYCNEKDIQGYEIGQIENLHVLNKEIEKEKIAQVRVDTEKQEAHYAAQQEQLKAIEKRISTANEQQARLEKERLVREEEQRELINDVFYYEQYIGNINNVSDPVVKAYLVKTKLDKILAYCADAQEKVNDYQAKRDYAKIINHAQRIKSSINWNIDTSVFSDYQKALSTLEQYKSQIVDLKLNKSKPPNNPSLITIILTGVFIAFPISLFLSLLFGVFIESVIENRYISDALIFISFMAMMGYFYYSHKKKVRQSSDNLDFYNQSLLAIKQSVESSNQELEKYQSFIQKNHPSFFAFKG